MCGFSPACSLPSLTPSSSEKPQRIPRERGRGSGNPQTIPMQYQAAHPREFQVHRETHSFLLPESFYSGTFQKQKHWCVSFAASGVEGVELRVFLLVSLGLRRHWHPSMAQGC